MVWLYLYEVARDHGLDLSNGILIHSGGWKKLIDRAVDNTEFRSNIKIDILNASKQDLLEDFQDATDWQKSGLFKTTK